MIIFYSLFLVIIAFLYTYIFITKDKKVLIFCILILIAIIGPSTKIFYFSNHWYNLQLARYITIFFYCIFMFRILVFKKISREMFLLIFLNHSLILVILIMTFIRNGSINQTYIFNIIGFIGTLMYSYDIFEKNKIISELLIIHFFSITLVFSSLLSLGVFSFEPFYSMHKVFYNYFLGTSIETLFEFVENNHRTYSIFSGPNQFSFFASINLIVNYFLYKRSILRFNKLMILNLLNIWILIVTGSRTGAFFYILTLFLILKNFIYNRNAILIVIALFILYFIFLPFVMPERIYESIFSLDLAIKNFSEQRLYFWGEIYELIREHINYLFFGFYENLFIENEGAHFESGYLQLIGIGGIFSFIIFIILLYHFYQLSKTLNPLHYVFILFCLGEFFMGLFFELKWSILNALMVGYIMSKTSKR